MTSESEAFAPKRNYCFSESFSFKTYLISSIAWFGGSKMPIETSDMLLTLIVHRQDELKKVNSKVKP